MAHGASTGHLLVLGPCHAGVVPATGLDPWVNQVLVAILKDRLCHFAELPFAWCLKLCLSQANRKSAPSACGVRRCLLLPPAFF